LNAAGPETFWAWREAMRDRMQGGRPDRAVEEGVFYRESTGPLPLDERLAQAIWAQQLFGGGQLRLMDGRSLRVLDQGRWNGAGGPDFRDARLMIDERPVRGDVEIHLLAGDWDNHGHARDLDYNGVALHAALKIDDGQAYDLLHNGERVPRLEMEPFVFPDVETLRRSMSADDFQYAQPAADGRCRHLMTSLEPGQVADFLDRAGEERLVAKMRRLEDQMTGAGDLEQVFYQATLMTLGAGGAKTLYYLLAKRAPVAELMEDAREMPSEQWGLAIEALLLGVAGLIPGQTAAADGAQGAEASFGDADALARRDALMAVWRRQEPYWRDRVMPSSRQWQTGVRPVNFATRRLAGMALLLARSMREGRLPFEDLMDRLRAGMTTLAGAPPTRRKRHPLLDDLMGRLRAPGEGHFWGTHYTFAARPAARPMDLIGEATAMSLVFNAFIPAALLQARREKDNTLEEAALRLFRLVPPLQPNHVTEFMTRRLFGAEGRGAALISTECRRQGLFQIFYHCCNGQERHCDACYYLSP
jgi:hypothetical protein